MRTWLSGASVAGAGLAYYHVWSYEHTEFGAVTAPRFSFPGVAYVALVVALAGLVLLAFDLRVRDERDRISEVMDARPVSNVALTTGRLLAIALATWLPLLLMAVLFQVGGEVVEANDWRFGTAPEPVSLATFLFVDAPPALLFWGAFVLMLSAVLRNRLAIVGVGLGLLALHVWLVFNTPLYLLSAVAGIANLGLPGSDILPRGPDGSDLVQRGGVVVLAVGLLVLASGFLPRRDGVSRTPVFALGGALSLLGAAGVAAVVWQAGAARYERLTWAAAHAAVADVPAPDLEKLSGSVSIDPGRELVIDVDLDIRAPREDTLEVLRFALNPGMLIESVRFGGAETPFRHELGLLTVTPSEPLTPGGAARLSITAHGVPDPRFGYLDDAFDALDETLLGSPAVVMGDKASLFHRRYVALTPAVRWLPLPGANRDTGPYALHPPDYHHVDLAVHVPDGWHVAGPGRAVVDGTLRLRPSVALPAFPVLAGPFERRARTVDGIEYELLIHPKHLASADYFVDGENAERFERLLKPRFEWLRSLPYSHEVLTFVEVPGQLRRYGGGWLMDAVQAMPGVQCCPNTVFRRGGTPPNLAMRRRPRTTAT